MPEIMPMADVPDIVRRGQIRAHLVSFMADGPDEGQAPDEQPLSGFVKLTPTVSQMKWPTADPPRTAVIQSLLCPVLDGWLYPPGTKSPASDPAESGVWVVATEQPEGLPNRVQWRASFELAGVNVQPSPVTFDVPDRGTVDLTTVLPAEPDPGVVTVVSTESRERAEAAAARAEDAADQVEEQLENVAPKTVVYGNDPQFGEPFSRDCLVGAIDYAETLGKATVVYLPAGIYDVGAGLSLAGKSVQLQGDGAYPTAWSGAGVPTPGNADHPLGGTVIWASQQDGPVLDFDGFSSPWAQQGQVTIGNFLVLGSGVADPTGANKGIRVGRITANFENISIINTGGACISGDGLTPGDAQYMVNWDSITLGEPVGCVENDIPWLYVSEANCSRFSRVGLRGLPKGSVFGVNVGQSGAVVVDSPATFSSASITFESCWFENLWVQDGSQIVSVRSIKNTFTNFQFIDCFKEPSNSTKTYEDKDTAYFRFLPAPGAVQGANLVTGIIPGRDHDYPSATGSDWHSIDYGVILEQGYNSIRGTKGTGSQQVLVKSGVSGTAVDLQGSRNSGQGDSVVNKSLSTGQWSNTVIDSDRKTIQGFRTVELLGDISTQYRTVTGSMTLGPTDGTLICNGPDLTITLPTPEFVATNTMRRRYVIKNTHATPVKLIPQGSTKIDGQTSLELAQWESVTLIEVGQNWVTLAATQTLADTMNAAIEAAISGLRSEILATPALRDTGLRDFSSYISNGWKGQLIMQRTGSRVSFRIKADGTNKTSSTVASALPTMFRPESAFNFVGGVTFDGGVGIMQASGTRVGTDWNAVYGEFITTAAFPTNPDSWPGVPYTGT